MARSYAYTLESAPSDTHSTDPSDHIPIGYVLPAPRSESTSSPGRRTPVARSYANTLSSTRSATHSVAPSDHNALGYSLPAAASVSSSASGNRENAAGSCAPAPPDPTGTTTPAATATATSRAARPSQPRPNTPNRVITTRPCGATDRRLACRESGASWNGLGLVGPCRNRRRMRCGATLRARYSSRDRSGPLRRTR